MNVSGPVFPGVATALAELFPPGCAVAVRSTASVDDTHALPDVERHAVAGAVPKRRCEFAAGRTAARAALAELGLEGAVIPVGGDRAPVWPAGFIGSISHAGGCAVAVAARVDRIQSLGIDIELSGALEERLWESVLSAAERVKLAEAPGGQAKRATTAFCAKEAFYKFQYPRTRAWIDYMDADVYLDDSAQVFTVEITNPRVAPTLALRKFKGRFAMVGPFTLAALWTGAAKG